VSNIIPLKDGFGLLNEIGNKDDCTSLIFLDLSRGSLQKLHTIKQHSSWCKIVVNKADLTTFLASRESTRIFKIVDKTIFIWDKVEIDFHPESFYGKYIYGFKLYDENGIMLNVRISYLYI
jgi:WD40 repeat protein